MEQGVEDVEHQEVEVLVPEWMFRQPELSDEKMRQLKFGGRKTTNEMSFTPTDVIKRVYGLGRTLCQMFEKFEMHYWTSGGTTLGAVRHGGLIPWDDDLDICILAENEPQFLKDIVPKLRSDYLVGASETLFGYRLFHLVNSEDVQKDEECCGVDALRLDYKYPFCDVFVMKCQGKHCVIREAGARSIWPKEKYKIQDVRSSVLLPFGDYHLRVPANPENYLDNYYGKGWMTVAWTQDYDHLTRSYVCPVSYAMKDTAMYSPAKPFS